MSDNKRCKVLLLPTKDRNAGIYKSILRGLDLIYKEDATDNQDWQPMHLYFISDDEVGDGDFGIHPILGVFQKPNNLPDHAEKLAQEMMTKIVASTDPLLGLPMIPELFVKKYVDCNGTITDVELEMFIWIDPFGGAVDEGMRLKLTDNNEVCIMGGKIIDYNYIVEKRNKNYIYKNRMGARITRHLRDKIIKKQYNEELTSAAQFYIKEEFPNCNEKFVLENIFKAGDRKSVV